MWLAAVSILLSAVLAFFYKSVAAKEEACIRRLSIVLAELRVTGSVIKRNSYNQALRNLAFAKRVRRAMLVGILLFYGLTWQTVLCHDDANQFVNKILVILVGILLIMPLVFRVRLKSRLANFVIGVVGSLDVWMFSTLLIGSFSGIV